MNSSVSHRLVVLLLLRLFDGSDASGAPRDKWKMSFYTLDWKNGTNNNGDNHRYQIIIDRIHRTMCFMQNNMTVNVHWALWRTITDENFYMF